MCENNKKNRLKNHFLYLSGPIDDVSNWQDCSSWRDYMTKELKKMGIKTLDPLNKPIEEKFCEGEEFIELRKRLKQEKKYDKLSKIMRQIRRTDLRMVDWSSAIVAYLNYENVMTGTIEEAVLANRQKKPCLVVCKQGIDAIMDWWWGTLNYKTFFNNFDECLEYIRHVHKDEEVDDLNGRWCFADFS